MMSDLQTADIGCPYCGEGIELLIDASVDHQIYIEDCSVCCRPIVVTVIISHDGTCEVRVRSEDE
jgi:hypothetical protein